MGDTEREENPFRVPTDDEIFKMREHEHEMKQQERELRMHQKVHEKTTWASKMGGTRKLSTEGLDDAGGSRGSDIARDSKGKPDIRRKDKENMTDFIAKKREMFLVQMALDTKRAEILKLDEQARQREEALEKSEKMLMEDKQRFENFLDRNHMRAQDEQRRAETETKNKGEKVAEIKRLNMHIGTLRSDESKYEEQLADLERYQKFLYSITPEEFKKEWEEKKARKKEERAAKLREERRLRGEGSTSELASTSASLGGTKDSKKAALKETKKRKDEKAFSAEKDKEDDDDDSDHEPMPLYFQSPQQVLEVFTTLEERNLFLIQNVQETEEGLEELKLKQKEMKAKMESEKALLQQQLDSLKEQIAEEKRKCERWDERMKPYLAEARGAEAKDLDELTKAVDRVYRNCGFDSAAQISMLEMLANFERRLEQLLAQKELMDPAYIKQAEKDKEKERRSRARDANYAKQTEQQQLKIKRSLERSQAPVIKKTGKPTMARSAPPVLAKKTASGQVSQDGEEEDVSSFFKDD